jgi:hypothetical protein
MNVLEWTQDKLETLEYIANTWIHDMGNVLDIHFPSENSIDKKLSLKTEVNLGALYL